MENEPIKITVSIDVPDLEKAILFYGEALGCTTERNDEKIAIVAAENVRLWLLKKEQGTKPIPQGDAVRTYDRHWTPIHLDIVTKDIDDVVAKVVAHGGTHEGGESGEWGSIAYCADPFGNGFCVINE